MEDKRILELLWERAEAALEALKETFGRRLNLTALNILDDPLDAEETVSDTYLALWNSIPPHRPESLAGYVYKTGRQLALKKLRHRTAQKRSCQYEVSLEELSSVLSSGTLEEQLDAKLLGQAINRWLGTLSESDRRVFIRRYWFGDRAADLAADLGIRPNNLSVRLLRLRNKLKDYLEQEGFFL